MISSHILTPGLLTLTIYCSIATLFSGPQTAHVSAAREPGIDSSLAYDVYVDAYDLNKCGLSYQQAWQTKQSAFKCWQPTGRQVLLAPGSHGMTRRRRQPRWWSQRFNYNFDGRNTRIADGTPAQEGEHPWFVHLDIFKPDVGGSYMCGGTLIHDNLVLTAAHCVENALSVRATLGTNMVDGSRGGLITAADRWCYGFERGDFAILRLREPVRYLTGRIGPACLRTQPRHDENTVCQVTGMGNLNDQQRPSRQLMSLPVRRNCPQFDPEQLISCYLADNIGTACAGDSGAPILCWDKCGTETSRAYVVGHVKGGPPQNKCRPGTRWYFFASDYNRMSDRIPQYISAMRSGASQDPSGIKCFSP